MFASRDGADISSRLSMLGEIIPFGLDNGSSEWDVVTSYGRKCRNDNGHYSIVPFVISA